jgi:hypothetical protein
LERRIAADAVKAQLEHRPAKEQLVSHGILKGRRREDGACEFLNAVAPLLTQLLLFPASIVEGNPALQAAKVQLEKQQKADALKHGLEARPPKEHLVSHGILKGKGWE